MMHKRVRILFIILLAAFGLLTPLLNALWNRVPAVSPDEAMAAIQSNPGMNILIDIRKTNDVYCTSVISNAMQEPDPSNLKPEFLRSKDKVFILCNTGFSSSQVVRELRQKGYNNVFNVTGGVENWIAGKTAPDKSGGCLHPSPSPEGPVSEVVCRNELTKFEQFIICFSGFGLKPLYEVVSLMIALLIWKWPEPHWRTLRWSMLAFFLGENACAINYLCFTQENFTWEFWHCYGMLVAFGLVFYALIGFVDHHLIRYSEKDKSCALLHLCKNCYKHKPVACNLRIIFLFAIPAVFIICFMPISAPFKSFISIGSVYGTDILFTHPVLQQLYEIRIYPVLAMLLLATAWTMLIKWKESAWDLSKMFFSAALGVIGFSMLRFMLFWSYSDNILWAEAWEEITEALFIMTIVVLLCIRWISARLPERAK
ncbi:MAG: rhodanese-like domain-containing protein [bacterium]